MSKRFVISPQQKEAKQKENFMKGKTYNYKLYTGSLLNVLCKQGRCKVLERNYSKIYDCDVLCVVDLDTKETLFANQYALKLKKA